MDKSQFSYYVLDRAVSEFFQISRVSDQRLTD